MHVTCTQATEREHAYYQGYFVSCYNNTANGEKHLNSFHGIYTLEARDTEWIIHFTAKTNVNINNTVMEHNTNNILLGGYSSSTTCEKDIY